MISRQGHLLASPRSSNPRIVLVEQFGFNHYLDNTIFAALDRLAECGVNGFRVFGFWPFGLGQEREPYLKINGKYDLNRFDEEWFAYQQQWVQYAKQRGILVYIDLFDPCGLKAHWGCAEHHPYYQITGTNPSKLSDLSNSRLMEIETAYVKKFISAVNDEHVIWSPMNEFGGDKRWHHRLSALIKQLAPRNLVAASHETSPATDDPNVDIWAVHSGTYDFKTGTPHVPQDIAALRQKVGQQKILTFSTDGFMPSGMFRENPDDMRRLAQSCRDANLQMLCFLDQKAYSSSRQERGMLAQLNVDTYRALVEEFAPTPFVEQTPLPAGFLDVFRVASLPSTHPQVTFEDGGKGIHHTLQQGFLCFGQYKTGYPTMPLKAFFSIRIDDNRSDDRNVLILDVYDHHQDRVIGKRLLTRKDFPLANDFCLFEFDFTPPSMQANMEFRIYYMGAASVVADKIAIVDPQQRAITHAADIPMPGYMPPPPPTPQPQPSEYCRGNELVCLPAITAAAVAQTGGRLLGGTHRDSGQFTPTPNGGIAWTFTLDADRHYVIECDLEGNIPHWALGEQDGGKVSLFTIDQTQGNYYLSVQRMYGSYRGGGRFRVILTDRQEPTQEGAAWLITSADLGGDYSMARWGNEPHHLEVHVSGNRCQLQIDQYASKWASAPFPIHGQRAVEFVLGNRESSRIDLGEAALTRFICLKCAYL